MKPVMGCGFLKMQLIILNPKYEALITKQTQMSKFEFLKLSFEFITLGF